MEDYLHRIVGLYPNRASAESAQDEMLAQGIEPAQLRLLAPVSGGAGPDARSDSDDVLKDLLRDGANGTAVGTAAGAGRPSRWRRPTSRCSSPTRCWGPCT